MNTEQWFYTVFTRLPEFCPTNIQHLFQLYNPIIVFIFVNS